MQAQPPTETISSEMRTQSQTEIIKSEFTPPAQQYCTLRAHPPSAGPPPSLSAADTEAKWLQFLDSSCCREHENVSVVCADGQFRTHRLMLVHAHFLKQLILQEDLVNDSVILVPDFTVAQVRTALCPFQSPREDCKTVDHDNVLSELVNILFSSTINQSVKLKEEQIASVENVATRNPDDLADNNKSRQRERRKKRKLTEDLEDFIVCDDTEENCSEDESDNKYLNLNLNLNLNKNKTTAKTRRKVPKKRGKKPDVDDGGKFKCEECGKMYSDEKYLSSHITKVHPDKSDLAEFIIGENSRKFKCKLCEKQFCVPRKLRYHLKIKHKVGAKFKCDTCNKIFYYDFELEAHKKFHFGKREHECETCGKKFFEFKCLEQHKISMHSTREQKEKNRKFVCSVCAKGFFSKSALQEHEFLHSDVKQFSCNACGKTFRQASGLRAHSNRYHSATGPKPSTEESKEKMRNYMKKYRAMKLGKMPNNINQRYRAADEQLPVIVSTRTVGGKLTAADVESAADLSVSRQPHQPPAAVYLAHEAVGSSATAVTVSEEELYSQQTYAGVYIIPQN